MKKGKKKGDKGNSVLEFTDHSGLLVFGYSSKLFRDDKKALSVERGETFIPWSGDPSLLLDRYDGRILLTSLDTKVHHGDSDLEEAEKIEEEMCEEERWRSLYHNDEELETQEEEGEKRAAGKGGEVHFSYQEDNSGEGYEDLPVEGPQLPPSVQQPQQQELEQEEEGEPYVPDASLKVPDDITIPPNIKLYNVILKTAKFVSAKGSQMEILLKTKQANNPAFQFLNSSDILHRFYQHLVYMIKTKQYKPKEATSEESSTVGRYGHSLLPSLVPYGSGSTDSAPKIPNVVYKPDKNSAYAQLINRIKAIAPAPSSRESTPAAGSTPPDSKEATPPPTTTTATQSKESTPPVSAPATPPPASTTPQQPTADASQQQQKPESSGTQQVDPRLPMAQHMPQQYLPPPPHGQHPPYPPHHPAYQQYHPHHPLPPPPHGALPPGVPPGSYASPYGPYAPPFIPPPPPGFQPTPHPGLVAGPPSVIPGTAGPQPYNQIQPEEDREATPPPGEEEVIEHEKQKTENPEGAGADEAEIPVVFPPPEIQTIIDKMASYVARNGRTFEDVVRAKDATRFSFLFTTDVHHGYYLAKLRSYTTGNFDRELVQAPLAFKVKKAEEKEVALENPSALPVDNEASDEENGEGKENEEEEDGDEANEPEPEPGPTLKAEPQIYHKEEEKKRQAEALKLKDKLAAAARDKMITNARERALQQERKKRAAQFLAQLAEKNTVVSSNEPVDQDESSKSPRAPLPPTISSNVIDSDSGDHGEGNPAPQEDTMPITIPSRSPSREDTQEDNNSQHPKLLFPKRQPEMSKKKRLSSDSSESSGEEEEGEMRESSRKRKRRRKSRSRSRSRDRRRRKRKRSRSRSSHRRRSSRRRHRSRSGGGGGKKKRSRKEKKSRKKRDDDGSRKERRRRNRRRSSSRSEDSEDSSEESRSRSRSKNSATIQIVDSDSEIEEIPTSGAATPKAAPEKKNGLPKVDKNLQLQPAITEIKEDLRAKVRALLGSTC